MGSVRRRGSRLWLIAFLSFALLSGCQLRGRLPGGGGDLAARASSTALAARATATSARAATVPPALTAAAEAPTTVSGLAPAPLPTITALIATQAAATARAGGATAPAGAAASGAAQACTLTSAQVPQKPGTTWEDEQHLAIAGQSNPSTGGPWDFTQVGGQVAGITRTIVPPAQAANGDTFPNATFAINTELKTAATNPARFRFFELRADGLYWIGDSDGTAAFKVDSPQKFQSLPGAVGQRWEQSYKDTRFQSSEFKSVYEILGCGTVSVPAGKFENALLVKTTFTFSTAPTPSITYSWVAPNLGQVTAVTFSAAAPDVATVTLTKSFKPG